MDDIEFQDVCLYHSIFSNSFQTRCCNFLFHYWNLFVILLLFLLLFFSTVVSIATQPDIFVVVVIFTIETKIKNISFVCFKIHGTYEFFDNLKKKPANHITSSIYFTRFENDNCRTIIHTQFDVSIEKKL